MDRVASLLDQIARLESQNRLETDPDLQEENRKTIKSLHEQIRDPWRGIVHKVVLLFVVFFIATLGLLALNRLFGLGSVALASTVIAIVLVIVVCTILLITGHISQDIFRNLVDSCLQLLPSATNGDKPSKPDKGAMPGSVAAKTIFAESDPTPTGKPPDVKEK